ncbi:flagellar hook-length control protein FliK [uncultured Hoeflea sp.]|uniref:flagellar hook-length control protein FliK n=1 Tax=uncultured Hoeflea sp. TaxID=538666 RepID=UPI0030EB7758|tara:strand:- start:33155 stop:34588 length:1434 start_codon:yes stop_codon:yes gene_type:complete
MSGGNAADGSRPDAFSAALTNEKRGAAADRNKVQSGSQADAGNEAADAHEPVSSQSGQSDDILNLLAGLKSSASYPDDAELGADGNQEDLASDLLDRIVPVEDDPVEGSADAGDDDLALTTDPLAGGIPVSGKEFTAKVANPAEAGNVDRQTAEQLKSGDAAAKTAAAAQTGDTKAGSAQADARVAASTPSTTTTSSTQAAAAAPAMAAQGTSAQPKASTPSSEPQKDPSALKEAMRALGLESGQGPANAESARQQSRDGNMGNRGDADAKRADELTSKSEGKVEVIESRRFMPAQNLSANAQMLTRSLAEASSNALAAQRAAPTQALAQTGTPQAGQTLHTLKLQLNPVSLGSVTAVLKLSGEDLSVEIKVQTAEAYRQIKDDNQSILKSLRGQGFGVEQITVQHVVGTDRASGQSAQQGFQAGQQGPGANDAQSFGRDGSGNNAGQQQSGSRGGQGHEQSSYAGSGAGRTDGVYL